MKTKNRSSLAIAAALVTVAVAGAAQAATFTPGNLIVTRAVGGSVDTTASPAPGSVAPIATPGPLLGSGVAATVELDEYTPTGSFVQAIILPNVQQTNTAAGSTYALTFSGTQNQEGTITLSGDGKYFALAGYNQTAGLPAGGNNGTNAVASNIVQRVVGVVSLNGAVNTTTGLTDVASTVSVRSAYTSNGTDIWVDGATKNAAQLPGLHYATIGSTTSVQISAPDPNASTEIINAFNFGSGLQLLASNLKAVSQATPGSTASFRGIATVGTGLPTAASITLNPVQLPGFAATTVPVTAEAADSYWFKDANTLYIADQRTDANGGVQKWVNTDTNADQVPDTWTFAYNITFGTGTGTNLVGAHGLSGIVEPSTGKVDLFATTFDGTGANATQLYSIVDTGTGFTDSLIATSATTSAFRGVAVIPLLMGDANNDARVDLNDLNTVLNNLGKTSSLRSEGNFDGAATIDLNDLNAVLNNLGQSFGGSAAAAAADLPTATPEPASLGLLGLGVAGVLLRRRRA